MQPDEYPWNNDDSWWQQQDNELRQMIETATETAKETDHERNCAGLSEL